jgi:drug/metabolite transporter (DMT)-like permease
MNLKVLLSFAVIYIIWGSTFTAIKYGLDTFPPFMLAGMRFLTAGTFFLLISKWKHFKEMSFQDVLREFQVGFLLTLANAGVCWSEQYLSSGVAALIVGSLPVMFMAANWISFEKKTPHYSAAFAFIVGLIGITLISTDGGASSDWKVVVILLLANCFWVAGSLLFRMTKSKVDYYPRASLQTLFGGMSLIICSTLMGERSVAWESVQLSGILSVAYLALAGTVLAYTAYSFLLKNVRTEITSTYALVNPLVALLFGILFLNEPLSVKVSIATCLILFSVLLVLYGDKLFLRPARVTQSKDNHHTRNP